MHTNRHCSPHGNHAAVVKEQERQKGDLDRLNGPQSGPGLLSSLPSWIGGTEEKFEVGWGCRVFCGKGRKKLQSF